MARFGTVLALACSCEGDPPPETAPQVTFDKEDLDGCAPGALPASDGACIEAGLQGDAFVCAPGSLPAGDGTCCAAGTRALERGCLAAGVSTCAAGFSASGDGCEPLLPERECPDGKIAIPGETACRDLASCGSGPWGDIPAGAGTIYVDAAFQGTSDGSEQNPYTSIGAAVAAASTGATIAIAAGSYAEEVILDKAVALWGRCPALVVIVAPAAGYAAISAVEQSAGSELHTLKLEGGSPGLRSPVPTDILLDRVWVHGGEPGIQAWGVGVSHITVRDSLIEAAIGAGIQSWGNVLSIERTVVRETLSRSDGSDGYGLVSQFEPDPGDSVVTASDSLFSQNRKAGLHVLGSALTLERSVIRGTVASGDGLGGEGMWIDIHSGELARGSATVRQSVIADNREIGIYIHGADLLLEDSVVSGTEQNGDGSLGRGIEVSAYPDFEATARVRSSLIEHNHDDGLLCWGGDVSVEASVIRDTLPRASDDGGGVGALAESTAERAGALTLDGCVIEQSHNSGVFAEGSRVALIGTLVQDTLPEASNDEVGLGLRAEPEPDRLWRTSLEIRGSSVERNFSGGVQSRCEDNLVEDTLVLDTEPQASDGKFGNGLMVFAAEEPSDDQTTLILRRTRIEHNYTVGLVIDGAIAEVEALHVRDNQATAADGLRGRAIQIQDGNETGRAARVTMSHSLIEDGIEMGIFVLESELSLEGVLVRNIAASGDGTFGDGIDVAQSGGSATLTMLGSRIEHTERAACAAFGGDVTISGSAFFCNPIDLNGETQLLGQPFSFSDGGGNRCGCGGDQRVCRLLESNIAPPSFALD